MYFTYNIQLYKVNFCCHDFFAIFTKVCRIFCHFLPDFLLSLHICNDFFFVLNWQAPLNTPVTEDKFAFLTEKRRIPVPLLPGVYQRFN